MSVASNMDALQKACYIDGNQEACRMIRGRTPMKNRGMEMAQGGLLEDASRNWRMESTYPESAKGEARSLEKGAVPTKPPEEKFMYSPLQRGYAEGGEVDMDTTGSMLTPEVPLNFEDDMPMDDMMMEDDMMSDNGLSAEQEEILQQATSDYPELEEILNILGDDMSMGEFTGSGQVEGAGTGTSDSIPAQLSDGEFVFTAKAVKQLGVDKLRKIMSKAEMDYNDGEERQEYAQMGDQGYAAGGYSIMKKPKSSYADGGSVEKHMNANQAESNQGLGSRIFDAVAKAANVVLGKPVDAMIDAFNTPSNSIDPDTNYASERAAKSEADFIRQNKEEADAQMARDNAQPTSMLDRKGM